jgi:hypothetical protein
MVGAVNSQVASEDHQEGEVMVLEAHSLLRSGTPEECVAGTSNRQEHGDQLLDRGDQEGYEERPAGFRVPR